MEATLVTIIDPRLPALWNVFQSDHKAQIPGVHQTAKGTKWTTNLVTMNLVTTICL